MMDGHLLSEVLKGQDERGCAKTAAIKHCPLSQEQTAVIINNSSHLNIKHLPVSFKCSVVQTQMFNLNAYYYFIIVIIKNKWLHVALLPPAGPSQIYNKSKVWGLHYLLQTYIFCLLSFIRM